MSKPVVPRAEQTDIRFTTKKTSTTAMARARYLFLNSRERNERIKKQKGSMGAKKETAMELLRGGADMTRNTYILVFDGVGSIDQGCTSRCHRLVGELGRASRSPEVNGGFGPILLVKAVGAVNAVNAPPRL